MPVSLGRQAAHLLVIKNNLMKVSRFPAVLTIPPQLSLRHSLSCSELQYPACLYVSPGNCHPLGRNRVLDASLAAGNTC